MSVCVFVVGYFNLESPLLQHRLQQQRRTQESITSGHRHVNAALFFQLGFVLQAQQYQMLCSYLRLNPMKLQAC